MLLVRSQIILYPIQDAAGPLTTKSAPTRIAGRGNATSARGTREGTGASEPAREGPGRDRDGHTNTRVQSPWPLQDSSLEQSAFADTISQAAFLSGTSASVMS